MTVRTARPEDAEAIARVHARGWQDTGTVKEQGLFGGAVVLTVALHRRPL